MNWACTYYPTIYSLEPTRGKGSGSYMENEINILYFHNKFLYNMYYKIHYQFMPGGFPDIENYRNLQKRYTCTLNFFLIQAIHRNIFFSVRVLYSTVSMDRLFKLLFLCSKNCNCHACLFWLLSDLFRWLKDSVKTQLQEMFALKQYRSSCLRVP